MRPVTVLNAKTQLIFTGASLVKIVNSLSRAQGLT